MTFTSGGGIGGNKGVAPEPPPWFGCLFLILIAVLLFVWLA